MKVIKAQFELYDEIDGQADSYTNRKSCDIDKWIKSVLEKTPDCDKEVIFEHAAEVCWYTPVLSNSNAHSDTFLEKEYEKDGQNSFKLHGWHHQHAIR